MVLLPDWGISPPQRGSHQSRGQASDQEHPVPRGQGLHRRAGKLRTGAQRANLLAWRNLIKLLMNQDTLNVKTTKRKCTGASAVRTLFAVINRFQKLRRQNVLRRDVQPTFLSRHETHPAKMKPRCTRIKLSKIEIRIWLVAAVIESSSSLQYFYIMTTLINPVPETLRKFTYLGTMLPRFNRDTVHMHFGVFQTRIG